MALLTPGVHDLLETLSVFLNENIKDRRVFHISVPFKFSSDTRPNERGWNGQPMDQDHLGSLPKKTLATVRRVGLLRALTHRYQSRYNERAFTLASTMFLETETALDSREGMVVIGREGGQGDCRDGLRYYTNVWRCLPQPPPHGEFRPVVTTWPNGTPYSNLTGHHTPSDGPFRPLSLDSGRPCSADEMD